jgi:hypothetical protein
MNPSASQMGHLRTAQRGVNNMGQVTKVDGPYMSFVESAAGTLTGKEGYAVRVNAVGTVVLSTGAGDDIGTIDRIDPVTREVTVRLFSAPGYVQTVQSAAIAVGARCKVVAGGQLATAGAGERSVGIKLGPAAGAANDHVSLLTVIEKI